MDWNKLSSRAISFKKLAYKSTGPLLEIGGGFYMMYGAFTGNTETLAEGFLIFCAGSIVRQRSKYVTDEIDRLNEKVSELERELNIMKRAEKWPFN